MADRSQPNSQLPDQALQLAHQQLVGILEGSPDLIAAIDREWRLTACNQAYRDEVVRLFGQQVETGVSLKAALAHLPETQSCLFSWQRALDGETFVVLEEFDAPDGVRSYETTYSPIRDSHQQIIGACHFVRNVTRRQRAERSLHALNETLEQRVAERTEQLQAINHKLAREVARRQQLEQSLRDREATRWQQLAEIESIYATAPIGLCFLDADLRFVRINAFLAEVNGIAPAEHLGRTVREVLTPDVVAQLEPMLQQVMASGEPMLNIEIHGASPGQPDVERDWVVSYYPLKNSDGSILGLNGMVQDITARKQMEQELRVASQKTTTLLESMTDAFVALDRDWRITYMNQHAAQLTSVSPQAVLGKTHWEVWTWSVGRIPEQQYRRAIAEQVPVHFEWCYEPKKTWYEVHAYPSETGLGIFFRDINDRKQAEASVQANEERLRGFVQANVIGMLYGDVDGGIHQANDEFLRIVGYSRADFEAGKLRWTDLTPPDWLPLDAERVAEAQARGACTPYEKEYYRKDGSRVPVLIGYSLVGEERQESVAFILDLTESKRDEANRKRAEAALRQSEARYRYLAELIPQLVWTADAAGNLLDVNQRWLDFTGITLAQAQSEGWQAIAHPDDLPVLSARWMLAQQSGTPYQAEGRIRRSDGAYRWHLHQALPLKDQGQVVKWFGTATDIEDQKQLEQQREHLMQHSLRILQQEQAAREQAELANRLKDEFLAVLSHELRTPLNPILGWARLLQSREFSQAQMQQALATIERNAKLQVQLIDDLLDMSRILRGKVSLNLSPLRLPEVIQAAIETVRLSAETKSIQIETHADPQVGLVLGDAGRLQQVVWNLLTNAIKFTSHGGRVAVQLRQVDRSAQLEVSDTGKGIAPDFLPHIFESFRQQDSSTTRQFGGLGLSIVRQLVELHNGTIAAHSGGEGQGTTFTICLPLLDDATPAGDRLPSQPAQDLNGVRVLAVDDETDSLAFMAVLLEQEGAAVTPVPSAQAALEAIDRSAFDVLVSDIGMPEMDGYELMRQIRSQLPSSILPAIALTAYAGETNQQQVLAAGFQQHLVKPVNPEELVAAIAALVERK